MKTTTYAWTCLACEADNAADSTQCSRCQCPARANGAQVAAARSAWQRRSGITPAAPLDVVTALTAFPLLLIAGAVLGLLGGVALIVSTGASFSAFGGLLLALAALCVSSYRKPTAKA